MSASSFLAIKSLIERRNDFTKTGQSNSVLATRFVMFMTGRNLVKSLSPENIFFWLFLFLRNLEKGKMEKEYGQQEDEV
jgi:hypothetical protein